MYLDGFTLAGLICLVTLLGVILYSCKKDGCRFNRKK